MATLEGVETNLARRCQWVKDESILRGCLGRPFWFTTGYRDMTEQNRLYANWLTALKKSKGNVKSAQKIAPLAAVPGTSMHGRSPALAVDIACDPIDNGLRAQLIREAGLITPVPGEPWHAQNAPGRQLPLPPPTRITLEKASKIMGKKAVRIIPTKSGNGYWIVASDGGVFCFGDAGFHGSAGGGSIAAPIIDADRTKSGRGYWLLGEDGGVFCFGDAQFYGTPVENNAIGYVRP